jgi:hypothetical protein
MTTGEEVAEMTDTESNETEAGSCGDAAVNAAAQTSAAATANDQTTVVPEATQQADALAWSTAETHEIGTDGRPLPRALRLLLIAVGLGALALSTFVVGQHSALRSPPTQSATTATAPVATPAKILPAVVPPQPSVSPQPTASPSAAPTTPPVDDDEYVAMAISPSAINKPHHAGYGTAGSQEEADRIAISECRGASGNDDCLLINAGRHHGCVGYAADPSERRWASGSGDDPDEAKTKARQRLGASEASSVAVQCSTPPGAVTPSEAPTPTAPVQDTESVPAVPPSQATTAANPTADQLFMRLIQQIPGTVIFDPATALAGGPRICAELASRGRRATDIDVQANDPGFAPWQAAAVVNAATTAYCPAYEGIS